MSITGFDYAQARLQSRHGSRPGAADWRRLHASGSLEHFLDACGRTGLAPWVAELHPGQDAHVTDSALAAAFERYEDEVASWLPSRWQSSVRDAPFGRRDADVEAWRSEWPRTSGAERARLDELVDALTAHQQRMRSADMQEDGWRLGDALEAGLQRLFRRCTLQPAAPLCHLALIALDLHRLRGAVLRRALFPDVTSEVSWV